MIGLMSGTSMDAIDGCCVKLWQDESGFHHKFLSVGSRNIPDNIKDRLFACLAGKGDVLREICTLNMVLGSLFADVAGQVMYEAGLKADDITAVASHGQTIYHQPPLGEGLVGSTLQIGEPSVIAERLGVTTIGDFRIRDMAVGGQGAPLVCLSDQLLFQDHETSRCVQNIGGIANVTVLPAKKLDLDITAFDTGPGNMLIDAAMRHYFNQQFDENGRAAAKGIIDKTLLNALLKHPFLIENPPKTTGREQFGEEFFAQLMQEYSGLFPEDVIATLTMFTAKSIHKAYDDFIFPKYPIQEIILGGGGTANPILIKMLTDLFSSSHQQVKISTHEAWGISNQYKESLAFAILGWATLTGQSGNIISCTGADRPALLGKIIL